MQLFKDRFWYVRWCVIQAISNHFNENTEKILLDLLHDKHQLIRVESADALCFFNTSNVYNALTEAALHDNYYMVRAYAALGACRVGIEIGIDITYLQNFMTDRVNHERRIFNKILCFQGLYLAGKKEVLDSLYHYFERTTYQNQCAILNTFIELINQENAMDIYTIRKKLFVPEEKVAVIEVMKELDDLIALYVSP